LGRSEPDPWAFPDGFLGEALPRTEVERFPGQLQAVVLEVKPEGLREAARTSGQVAVADRGSSPKPHQVNALEWLDRAQKHRSGDARSASANTAA
jgi:hypothetical protein